MKRVGVFIIICVCEKEYGISGFDLSLELILRLSSLEGLLEPRGTACPFQLTDHSPSGNAAIVG